MRKGFTVVEILIAMALLGFIAAVTIPLFNSNILKKEIETSYMKVVGILENANMLMMNNNDAINLDEVVIPERDTTNTSASLKYIQGLENSELINISSGVNVEPAEYKTFDGNDVFSTFTANDSDLFVSSNGSFAIFDNIGDPSDYYLIAVDLNGPSKKPNMVGRDLQLFTINRSTGKVYGFGSKKGGPTDSIGLYEQHCNKNYVSGDGKYCSGSIMDNGGKITYKW